jgi:hypothetical protein
MTTDDPEDQAERRRVGGLLHESAELGMRGWGAKIPQRRPSRNSTRKIFAVFHTGSLRIARRAQG